MGSDDENENRVFVRSSRDMCARGDVRVHARGRERDRGIGLNVQTQRRLVIGKIHFFTDSGVRTI